MNELHRLKGERPQEWLERLLQLPLTSAPNFQRHALACMVGYARYLLRRERDRERQPVIEMQS